MNSRTRSILSLAVLGGLVGALAAAVFLPGLAVGADAIAVGFGGLVVYALVAMAFVGRPRHRVFAPAATRRQVADDVIALPARQVVLRARVTRRDAARLAA